MGMGSSPIMSMEGVGLLVAGGFVVLALLLTVVALLVLRRPH
jgi:hypothetical protein